MKLFASILISSVICCRLVLATESKDVTTARPFLIVPGQSIGKVVLGQERATVHRKMGSPAKSRSLEGRASEKEDDEDVVKLVEDVWQRKISEAEKRNREKFLHDTFSVYYVDNRVVQVTISLSGYATSDGLSLDSNFDQFAKRFGEAVKSQFNLDPDGGISHTMVSIWDFQKKGLTIESYFYTGGNSPAEVLQISVHNPNQAYLLVH